MEEKLKRGCILSGWLWLELIGSFISIIITLFIPSGKLPGVPEASSMQQILSTIINIIFFVSIIGILRWKKVFTYGYIGATLLSFVTAFIGQKFEISMFIGALIGVLLNLWASYALFRLFEKLEIQCSNEDAEQVKDDINL
ncbi:TMEM199/VMA12 family protein [Clostridium novyi]